MRHAVYSVHTVTYARHKNNFFSFGFPKFNRFTIYATNNELCILCVLKYGIKILIKIHNRLSQFGVVWIAQYVLWTIYYKLNTLHLYGYIYMLIVYIN